MVRSSLAVVSYCYQGSVGLATVGIPLGLLVFTMWMYQASQDQEGRPGDSPTPMILRKWGVHANQDDP